MSIPESIIKISDGLWELPRGYRDGMRVPGRIYATEQLLHNMDETVFSQVANVAALPGIMNYSFCMPDGHSGYGFPIGGVAAMDPETGVISPGGIGFDINCGMRLVRTDLTLDEVKPQLHRLVDALFKHVPVGAGRDGFIPLSRHDFCDVIEQGAAWCVKKGFGWPEDLAHTEEHGCMKNADARKVSKKAIERGCKQIGTLGSGNHYLEIQVAKPENIFDQALATQFGIDKPNQVVVMFHCGSRGFGHQVATDYLQTFLPLMEHKFKIPARDRELSCAPFRDPEGQNYFAAMACAVNMAYANRQAILHRIREVFADVFHQSPEELGMHQIYDVSHNTAKLEMHEIDGCQRQLLVHRKGATRALGPGMSGLPERYKTAGQPVIIGGSMETGSYLLSGVESGKQAFHTTAHGSGRTMSRHAAKQAFHGQDLQRSMQARGIYVQTTSYAGLAEEAGGAYKDVDEVTAAAELCGLSRRVARLVPLGNIKG